MNQDQVKEFTECVMTGGARASLRRAIGDHSPTQYDRADMVAEGIASGVKVALKEFGLIDADNSIDDLLERVKELTGQRITVTMASGRQEFIGTKLLGVRFNALDLEFVGGTCHGRKVGRVPLLKAICSIDPYEEQA